MGKEFQGMHSIKKLSYPYFYLCFSCFQALWDINRWGTTGTRHFRYNIHYLLNHLKWCLRKAPHCQVIWMTTPPIRCVKRKLFTLPSLPSTSNFLSILAASQVPHEIGSGRFHQMFVFGFSETSQNFVSFRQLLFSFFQRQVFDYFKGIWGFRKGAKSDFCLSDFSYYYEHPRI